MGWFPIEVSARTTGADSAGLYAPPGQSESASPHSFGDHLYRSDDATSARPKSEPEERPPAEPWEPAGDAIPVAGPVPPTATPEVPQPVRSEAGEAEAGRGDVPAARADGDGSAATGSDHSAAVQGSQQPPHHASTAAQTHKDRLVAAQAEVVDAAGSADAATEGDAETAVATELAPQPPQSDDGLGGPGSRKTARAVQAAMADKARASALRTDVAEATLRGESPSQARPDAETPSAPTESQPGTAAAEDTPTSMREARKSRGERHVRGVDPSSIAAESQTSVAIREPATVVAAAATVEASHGTESEGGENRSAGKRKVPHLAAKSEVPPHDSLAVPGRELDANTNSPRRAQHLVGKVDEPTARAGVAEVDTSRFLDRVARAFRSAGGRDGVVKVRLHPPELGSLRVELRVQNGVLTAHLETETAAAQTLLIDHSQSLRDRLAEQGIRVERFDVDLLDRHTPDQSGAQQQRSFTDDSPFRPAQRHRDTPASAVEPIPTVHVRPAPGQLNVIV